MTLKVRHTVDTIRGVAFRTGLQREGRVRFLEERPGTSIPETRREEGWTSGSTLVAFQLECFGARRGANLWSPAGCSG